MDYTHFSFANLQIDSRNFATNAQGNATSVLDHCLEWVIASETRPLMNIIVKKLNSLKHLVRTTVAESHN